MTQALTLPQDKNLMAELQALMWQAGEAILSVYHSSDFGAEWKRRNSEFVFIARGIKGLDSD